jgi:GTP:adenosylcobinamide-phosphate guanylyltransferase
MESAIRIQVVLVAGDRRAARAVRGSSKAFVEIAGKPMVVHVLEALLHTPEVSEIFLVGDAPRLQRIAREHGCLGLASARSRPLHFVPQRDSLYENVWYTFLRTLPEGPRDEMHPIVVVPADVPLVVPEELSDFIRKALATGADYAVGLSPDAALAPYRPSDAAPGLEMACFNLREGRFRQNNLHLVRPLRMGNRHYIQDMYENRYQKQIGPMLRLAGRILRRELRQLWVLWFYLLMHVAGWLDRRGNRAGADRVRAWIPLATVERGVSALLRTRFCVVTTELGGAALDIDNDEDLEVADKMLFRWKELQARLASSSTTRVA